MRTGFIAATLLVAASASFAQNKPAKPAPSVSIQPPTLIDAAGTPVGLYQAPSFGIFRFNGAVIVAGVRRDGQSPDVHSTRLLYTNQEAYFPSADCSGPPIPVAISPTNTGTGLSYNIHGGRPYAYVRTPGGQVTIYIAANAISTVRSAVSRRTLTGSCDSFISELVPGYDVESVVIMPPEPLTVQ